MLSKVPPAFKFALPVTLLASPLLLAAAQPVDLETYGIYCNDPSTSSQLNAPVANASEQSGPLQSDAIAQPSAASAASMAALVRSERQMSVFSSDRWPAALRLLLSNPYAESPTASHPQPSAAPADSNCLADKGEPSASSAARQSFFRKLPLSSGPQVAQASGELPDLSGPLPTPAPAVKPPAADIPAVEPPAAEPPAKLPAVEPPAVPSPSPNPSPLSQPPSFDPSNVTPTTVNPTPFNGRPITTLAALSDGNYRYLSGEAEDRLYTREELQQRGGALFVFKKEGNVVTGNLLPRIGLPGICVTGIASGNTVSGEAYPEGSASTVSDRTVASETFQPQGSGALQIRHTTRTASGGLYYAGAILDLSNFSMINAGPSLPPASCNMGRTAN